MGSSDLFEKLLLEPPSHEKPRVLVLLYVYGLLLTIIWINT